MGDNGSRPCELDRLSGELELVVGPTVLVGGLTELVGGVSGTGASGEENRVGDMQSVGVFVTNADELELLSGVEDELLDDWYEEADLEEEVDEEVLPGGDSVGDDVKETSGVTGSTSRNEPATLPDMDASGCTTDSHCI